MAKATALDKARRVRQHPKPKSRSASIGPDGPKHPGDRQLYDKRGRPDAGARLRADYPKHKVATFCAALWPTFTLPLTIFIKTKTRLYLGGRYFWQVALHLSLTWPDPLISMALKSNQLQHILLVTLEACCLQSLY
jgi:hypothetical protein